MFDIRKIPTIIVTDRWGRIRARWELFNARALAYRKLGRLYRAAIDGARALQLRAKKAANKMNAKGTGEEFSVSEDG